MVKVKKNSFELVFGLFFLVVLLTPAISQFTETTILTPTGTTAWTDIPSSSAAPVITDMGAGIYNPDFSFWSNLAGNGPWEFGSYDPWTLFWYVTYTSDAPISEFNYNLTYGSLDGYNGSFTPLYPAEGPYMKNENKMTCDVATNPDVLIHFGWEVKVWIEDSDGLVSAPLTKLFKYHNGSIEETEGEPVILDLGGGTDNYGGLKEDYTDIFPWTHTQGWGLYWNVEFTNVSEIANYVYNYTYGSLSAYNGTFTPLSPVNTNNIAYGNEMICGETVNPDNLADFGYLVTVLLEDDNGVRSDPFSKVFKYNNGTLPEELEFNVTILTPVVSLTQSMEFEFTISDPEGPRTYEIDYIFHSWGIDSFQCASSESISLSRATFTPFPCSGPAEWLGGATYEFTFNLTVWESDTLLDWRADNGSVYANLPPENGSIYAASDHVDGDYRVYLIESYGWEDDLDGEGPFLTRILTEGEKNNIDDPLYPHDYSHNGSYDEWFYYRVHPDYSGKLHMRVFDSHGDFAQLYLLDVAALEEGNWLPGYPVTSIFFSIIPVIAFLVWKTKKNL